MTEDTTTSAKDQAAAILAEKTAALLEKIPENQRQAAAAIVADYGPALLEIGAQDAWQLIRRLQAGDIEVVAELDGRLSTEAWMAKVKANTAAWETVARFNVARQQLRNEFLLRLAPVMLSILAAMVGL